MDLGGTTCAPPRRLVGTLPPGPREEEAMNRFIRSSRVAAVLSALALSGMYGVAGAAPPEGGGGSGGGGTGGSETGDVFADLIVVLRDVDGVPILRDFEVPSDIDPSLTVTEWCVQPVSSTPLVGVTGIENPVDRRIVYPIPLMGDPSAPPPPEGEEVEACDAQPAYAMFVVEAELERLNMARQPDEFNERKLADVETKVLTASEIALDGAGRITLDGVAIDAAPEAAAIYESLMTTGTLPGLAVEPAEISPFDTWQLAATAVGTALGKESPLSIDGLEYYNRIAEIPQQYVGGTGWTVDFLETTPSTGEQFVDYGEFSYTRSDVFTGCATWLDVPSLTWMVSPVLELVDFHDLPPIAIGGTVGNAAAFAQLADDVRAVIVTLHENDVMPGFFIDPVGENTCAVQQEALLMPAVNWDAVPTDIVQTDEVEIGISAYMPWGGTAIDHTQLRLTIDAVADFTDPGQVTAEATDASGSVAFALDAGNLVGTWTGGADFPLAPGDVTATTFDLTIANLAPDGEYTLTVDLLDTDQLPADQVVATDVSMTTVHAAALTVLWTEVFDYTTQGAWQTATARVFNPDLAQPSTPDAALRVTIDAPEDFVVATQVAAYAESVGMPFVLDAGDLVGTWPLGELTVPADVSTTWDLTVADGAPVGVYEIAAEVLDGASATIAGPDRAEFIVVSSGGDPGEPTLPPVTTITDGPDVISNSDTAMFGFETDDETATFECSLDGAAATTCSSPVTYTGLADGEHAFAVHAVTDQVGPTAVRTWTVDTVAPLLTLTGTPPASTASPDATFTFDVDGATSVLCSLDGTALETCTSPVAYSDLDLGAHTFVVAAIDAAGNHTSQTYGWTIELEPSMVVTVWPSRVADTRVGFVAADGLFVGTGPVVGGSTLTVPVAGRAGVPDDAVAVMLNVTIAGASADGYATVFGGGVLPPTSSVNYRPGSVVANEVMVQLSAAGEVSVYVHSTAHVILDVVGFVPAGSDYEVLTPSRVADTRVGFVAADGLFVGTGPVVGGSTLTVPVAGRAGVPDDAVAVMLNVTIAGASADGYATVFGGGVLPPTSSVNYRPGSVVANEVMVQLSAAGEVSVYVHSTAHVILDVVGFVPAGSDYEVLTPSRVADTGWGSLLRTGCSWGRVRWLVVRR